MSQSKSEFKTKVRTITHWVQALLWETNDDSIVIQHVRQQIAERTEFDDNEIVGTITNSSEITVSGVQSGSTRITDVDPVGERPDDVETYLKRRNLLSENSSPPGASTSDSPDVELTDLSQIGTARADVLKAGGFETVTDIAHANPEDITDLDGFSGGLAQKLIAEAAPYADPSQARYETAIEAIREYSERYRGTADISTPFEANSRRVGDTAQPAPPPRTPGQEFPDDRGVHLFGLPVLERRPDHPGFVPHSLYNPIKAGYTEGGDTIVEAVASTWATGDFAVCLIGPAGSGKDHRLKWVSTYCNRPLFSVNLDESLVSGELFGQFTVTGSGEVEWKDGSIVAAVRNGYTLILTEVNAAPPEVLVALNSLLEKDNRLYVKENDEVIDPHPQFRLGMTMNPATADYGGRKRLGEDFFRRVKAIRVDYLDFKDELDLLDETVNADRQVIDRDSLRQVVLQARRFRAAADAGSPIPRLTPTDIEQVVDEYDRHGDLPAAVAEVAAGNAEYREVEAVRQAATDLPDPDKDPDSIDAIDL